MSILRPRPLSISDPTITPGQIPDPSLIQALALVFHAAWLLSGASKRKNAPELG